jgi:hypothetical protein
MKQNVLIFPCGSEIGLEIYRSLSHSTHFTLIGGSSVDDHGRFVYENYIGDMPTVDAADFIKQLNAIIAEREIRFIIPAHDSVVLALAKAAGDGVLACPAITSPYKTCQIARSKRQTYVQLGEIVRVPQLYDSVNDVSAGSYPIFLKPDVGQGSKGTYLAQSAQEAEFYLAKDSSLLILEYLPGKEYTVDCFTDKSGTLRVCEGRERSRITNGISVDSSVVVDEQFEEIAQKLNQHLTFRGAWFFQLKINQAGEYTLLEIAPRIAGTSGILRCRGINLSLLSLFDAKDYGVDIIKNEYDLVIDRALENRYKHNIAYDRVYIDFDDLLIFDDKVNPEVVAFVYQCVNKGVAVYLITRHAGDLQQTLKRYRLEGLFDDVIWIQDGQPKADFIEPQGAIFIDDSFAERKAVYDQHGIPVFDKHMIEALMED